MESLLQKVQKWAATKAVPKIKTGHTVRVHQRITEGEKTRTQIFEGLVIKVNSGYGADKTITVRKVVEGIGVEKIFPLYSPNVEKIEVKKQSKVRRAKLYYMRERSGKSARLKERFLTQEEMEAAVEVLNPVEEKAEETTEEVAETAETTEETAEAVTTEEVPAEEAPAEEKVEEPAAEAKEEAPVEESKEEEKSE